MFFIKIYIKESYINYYDTSIQMCGQYCILAPISGNIYNENRFEISTHLKWFRLRFHYPLAP